MIDAHCHIEALEDAGAVLAEARQRGVAVVSSPQNAAEARRSFELQQAHPGFFTTAGFHTSGFKDHTPRYLEDYIAFVKEHESRISGIGEVGLDYYWVKKQAQQREAQQIFARFIALARGLRKPLVVHCREAYQDTYRILEEQGGQQVMMHCFSGSEEQLRLALDRGYVISLATNVCYTKKHAALARLVPLDSLVLESDSPWLNPFAPRQPANRPWHIAESAKVIGKLRGMEPAEVLGIAAANTRDFFGLVLPKK